MICPMPYLDSPHISENHHILSIAGPPKCKRLKMPHAESTEKRLYSFLTLLRKKENEEIVFFLFFQPR